MKAILVLMLWGSVGLSISFSNTYIDNYTIKSFLLIPALKGDIDTDNVDEELLEASVFFFINQFRKLKTHPQLNYNHELDSLSSYCWKKLSDRYYIKEGRGRIAAKKHLKRNRSETSFHEKLIYPGVKTGSMIKCNTKKRVLTLNQQHKDSICQYYYPKKRTFNKRGRKLKSQTYKELGKQLARKIYFQGKYKLYLRGISDVNIRLSVMKRTIRKRHTIPRVKVLILSSGYRLARLKEE